MLYLGIDVGGTDIKIGILDENANILAHGSTKTGVGQPYQEIIHNMAEYSLTLLKDAGYTLDNLAAVGVGVPGVATNTTGVVMRCVNMEWWNIPLRDELQKYIPRPVTLGNDANLAGFAESVCGVSKGTDSSVFYHAGHGCRRRADLLWAAVERTPQRRRRAWPYHHEYRRHSLHLRQKRLSGALLQRHGADPHRQRGRGGAP